MGHTLVMHKHNLHTRPSEPTASPERPLIRWLLLVLTDVLPVGASC